MKNKLIDLNDHLFCQMERLNDESLTDDDLNKEILRAQAMVDIASNIVRNSSVLLKAYELKLEYGLNDESIPKLISTQQQ